MAQQSVVMVTGALTSIGRATASAFARRGDVVVVAGRHDDVGEQFARELKDLGARDSLFVRADVACERDVADLVETTVQHFGRLDVAVNNAGTEGRRAPITESTATSFSETFGANVLGTMLSMKHELQMMQGQGSGAIVNLASIHGGHGLANPALYAVSKQAVISLTRTAALEAASSGVRVNAVGAEHIRTTTFAQVCSNTDKQAAATGTARQSHAGLPEEAAEAILFLTGEQDSFLTGQTLFIGGGVEAD